MGHPHKTLVIALHYSLIYRSWLLARPNWEMRNMSKPTNIGSSGSDLNICTTSPCIWAARSSPNARRIRAMRMSSARLRRCLRWIVRAGQQGQAVTGLTWPFPGPGSGVYKRSAEVLSWTWQIYRGMIMTIIWSCIIGNLIIIVFEHAGSLGHLIWPHLSRVECNYSMIWLVFYY